MKWKLRVLSIDGEFPYPEEMKYISESLCMKCGLRYTQGSIIRFVRLSNGDIIWWHAGYNCDEK